MRAIKEKFNLTVISITHDIDEANLADRILVMNRGELVMDDVPERIFGLGEQLIQLGLDVPLLKN